MSVGTGRTGRSSEGLPTRRSPVRGGEGGFVLAFVVFMLFAISVASLTGYMIVSTEFEMARGSSDGAEALTVARAGLERFVAENLGAVPDTVSYAVGNAVATVSTRKLFARDSITDVYYLRSEATVFDLFSPNTPARRVVGGYATHRRRPLAHHAVVALSSNRIDVDGAGEIDGDDEASATDCSGGGATAITGAIARYTVTEAIPPDIDGNPDWETWSGGWQQIADSMNLRWDVLTDPEFPVDFENTMPDFSALPADSFPVVRYTGWMGTGVDGRGLLIVDGVFDPPSSFHWRGIILARHVDDLVEGHIDGLLVQGFEGENMYGTVDYQIQSHYNSCYVYSANESLSYLELIPSSIHETS